MSTLKQSSNQICGHRAKMKFASDSECCHKPEYKIVPPWYDTAAKISPAGEARAMVSCTPQLQSTSYSNTYCLSLHFLPWASQPIPASLCEVFNCKPWNRSVADHPAPHPLATCLWPSSFERNVIHQNISRCAGASTPRHIHSWVITRGHRAYYTQQHTYSYPRHTCRFNKTAPILMASLTSRLYISCGKRGGLWLLGGSTSMYTVQMECLPEKREQGG